ncbi:MAG: hypothetical protein GY769_09230 [bacterium]|nr:hypothetical protein [bacterium]
MLDASERPVSGGGISPRRFALLYVLPTFLLLLLAVWPVVAGLETFFFRDVFNTHLEMKWWQAEAMKDGFMPLVDPYRSGGQPHTGNPNTVALYPSNLLYLFTPLLWAFNAHFWLHLLLAPVGAFWLGRRLGLGRGGAWAAGVFFGASGYLLSNLNLYNLVAGAVLIPPFTASILSLCSNPGRNWRLAVVAVLWCLLILAGDPMTAAIGFGIGVSALWMARPNRRGLAGLALALAAGTLLAAPLWIEFVRIVGLSFRGHWGYSPAGATEASWHPAAIAEWFIPFAYGRPDLTFWGHRFYSGAQPLFYSFYPGLLAIVCFLLGLFTGRRFRLWALALIGLGLFLALGGHNPVVAWLLSLPGLSVLRLPVKFWPLVAVPAAMVAGLGFDRCLAAGGAGRLRRASLALAAAYLIAWLLATQVGASVESVFSSWMPAGFASAGLAAPERLRWAGLSLQFAGLAVAVALATLVRPRVFRTLGPALLIVHLAVQLALLRPLYRAEPVSLYRTAPSASVAIPPESVAAHGAAGGLFGKPPIPIAEYPDPDPRWLQRQIHNESYPYVGMMQRRRFEFALSPEGLDSFLTRATTEAFAMLPDEQRIRLLEASGVEWLYMKRELGVSEGVELAGRFASQGADLLLYRLTGAAAPAQFVSEFVYSSNLNDALTTLTSPGFRPREQVVIAGSGSAGSGMTGTVEEVTSRNPEARAWRVEAEGFGALVIQRTYLPTYRVEVDGEEITPWVANMHRIAVPVEAGDHVVRLWPSRLAFRLSVAVALLTAVGLVLYVSGAHRKRPGSEAFGLADV